MVNGRFNVKDLPVAEPGKAPKQEVTTRCTVARAWTDTFGSFARTCPTGTFKLYVSVGKADGTPQIALPYENDDGHHRYLMGTIVIQE